MSKLKKAKHWSNNVPLFVIHPKTGAMADLQAARQGNQKLAALLMEADLRAKTAMQVIAMERIAPTPEVETETSKRRMAALERIVSILNGSEALDIRSKCSACSAEVSLDISQLGAPKESVLLCEDCFNKRKDTGNAGTPKEN